MGLGPISGFENKNGRRASGDIYVAARKAGVPFGGGRGAVP